MPTEAHFLKDLLFAKSKEGKTDQILLQYYPNIKEIHRVPQMDRQRVGIDLEIVLDNGERFTCQEKWRRREYSGDFLIEYCSVEVGGECKKPGWIYTIDSNLIAAVYPASEVLVILPVLFLKRAWGKNKDSWMQRFRKIPTRNDGYNTLSLIVPMSEIWDAIKSETVFHYQQALWSVEAAP